MDIVLSPEILERLSDCKCGEGNKAIYYCDNEGCKLNKVQPYYCEGCMSRDKHNHLPEKIH